MEDLIKLKDILLNIGLSSCNLVQYADIKLQDELVKSLIKRFNDYNDEKRKLFPFIIDASTLQKFSIQLEEHIIDYSKSNNIDIMDSDYEILELRKKAITIDDIDELRKFKRSIFCLEKESNGSFRDMKRTLLTDYLISLLPLTFFEQNEILKDYLVNGEIESLKKKINLLSAQNIDIDAIIYLETQFYDYESFYYFLKNIGQDYRKVAHAIVIRGESIVDYDLQENLNYHMCNQRSGVFTLNFLTADTIYHSFFQKWYLEETHDIRTTNVKSKRYIKDIGNHFRDINKN